MLQTSEIELTQAIDASALNNDVPDGYEPLFRTSPFLECIGPIYYKKQGAGFIIGMRVLEKHTNASNTMHGGLISTLADISLGYTTALSRSPAVPLITANMTVDFIGTAKIGEWVESHVSIQKLGSQLAFANTFISTDSRPIARASAVFLVK